MAAKIKKKKPKKLEKPQSHYDTAEQNLVKLSLYVSVFRDLVDICGLIAYCENLKKINKSFYETRILDLRRNAMIIAGSLKKYCEYFGWRMPRRDFLINRLVKEKYRRKVFRYYLDNYLVPNSVITPGDLELRYNQMDEQRKKREAKRMQKKKKFGSSK